MCEGELGCARVCDVVRGAQRCTVDAHPCIQGCSKL